MKKYIPVIIMFVVTVISFVLIRSKKDDEQQNEVDKRSQTSKLNAEKARQAKAAKLASDNELSGKEVQNEEVINE
jgi:uncharacterized protein YaiL (DUF2058 family)